MNIEEREKHWGEIIRRYQASGMALRTFCDKEQIPYSTLRHRLGKLRRSGSATKENPRHTFIEFNSAGVPHTGMPCSLEITWPSGMTMRASADYPVRSLIELAEFFVKTC